MSAKLCTLISRTIPVLLIALVAFAIATPPASAADPGKNWRVYNRVFTPKLWDINQTQPLSGGVLQFPIQQFVSTTTGSFAVYLLNNHNGDITGQTFNMLASWTPGVYKTRSAATSGAYVRFEFQDVTASGFTSNDYWWSSVNLDLNDPAATGTISASLADRSLWSNICGQSATDPIAHPGPNCVGGTDPAVSPFDGFTKAMKNVKQLGLSFGNASSYASGVALDGGTGSFQLFSFSIN